MKALESLFEALRTAARQGKPMSLRQAAVVVIAISGIVLLYAAGGIQDLLTGHTHHALLYCGLAVLILMTLPIHVYNFLRVKRGVVVPNPWLMFGPLSQSVRVPLSIKVALIGSLTLLVTAVSYLSLSPLHVSLFQLALHHRAAARLLGIVIGFNLFLWVIVAFAWYLFVVLHKQEPQGVEPTLEPGKEVWPPAPSAPEKP